MYIYPLLRNLTCTAPRGLLADQYDGLHISNDTGWWYNYSIFWQIGNLLQEPRLNLCLCSSEKRSMDSESGVNCSCSLHRNCASPAILNTGAYVKQASVPNNVYFISQKSCVGFSHLRNDHFLLRSSSMDVRLLSTICICVIEFKSLDISFEKPCCVHLSLSILAASWLLQSPFKV